MAVTTLNSLAGRTSDTARQPGLFARILQRIIDARTLQAQHYVNAYLRSLDAKTLADLGYDRAELVKRNAGVSRS